MSWLSRFLRRKKEKKKTDGENLPSPSKVIEGKRPLIAPIFSEELTPEREEEMLDKMAKYVVKYGMEVPAILFLQTIKPGVNIGSQLLMVYAGPMMHFFGVGSDYLVLFQKIENVERLLKKIEEAIDT